jgi:hypothetical protein
MNFCRLTKGDVLPANLRAGRSGIRSPEGARDFSLLQNVQTGNGAHPASYSVGTTDSFPCDKAAAT